MILHENIQQKNYRAKLSEFADTPILYDYIRNVVHMYYRILRIDYSFEFDNLDNNYEFF